MNLTSPTPLPEVNAVLAELVRRLQEILGPNLIGIYLQGSFAVGDFTDTSDVDFMVVVASDVDPPVLAQLQRMHAEINERPSYWAKHLEGSYAPAAVIRKLTAAPRDPPGELPRSGSWRDPGTGFAAKVYPFFFLNNGDKTLARSEHDNTQVVRWVVREKGVALVGPPATTLIDPVLPDDLRHEVRTNLRVYTDPYLSGKDTIAAIWLQAFFVTVLCRMLHTLETGEIHSKRSATQWALKSLPAKWHGLIERAAKTWTQQQETWHQKPASSEVAATLDFMRFALQWCR